MVESCPMWKRTSGSLFIAMVLTYTLVGRDVLDDGRLVSVERLKLSFFADEKKKRKEGRHMQLQGDFVNPRDMRRKRLVNFWRGVGSTASLRPNTSEKWIVEVQLVQEKALSDMEAVGQDFAMVGQDLVNATVECKTPRNEPGSTRPNR